MSLIKKPSQLDVNPTLTALFYGQPGTGKSTLALSAPTPVLFDFDGGVNRLNGAHQTDTVQVRSWEDVIAALDEVAKSTTPCYQTIVIDTAGKLLTCMEEYIKRTQPKMRQADGSLSLKGYGQRKQMFINFNRSITAMGKHVIYVAHEIEQKRGDETILRPEVGGSSSNDLIKELDLVGYVEMYGKQRIVTFDPCDRFYAKNTCNMDGAQYLPTVVENGVAVGENNFLQTVIANYRKRLESNKVLTAKFESLCSEIRDNAASIENAEDANKFVEWVKGVEHVYNSKAVAQHSLQAKVAQLGLKFDKSSKTYSDGNAA